MSKEKKSVNYGDYAYVGDETITMDVQSFVAIRKALDKALQNGLKSEHPQVLKYYDMETMEEAENPTDKQIKEGKVRQFADTDGTFNQDNIKISYDTNIYPEIFNGLQTAMVVHQSMIEKGVAKPIEEVKKAYEERQAKGQMKVEEEKAATMNVVRNKEQQ